jgi:hypothetical protein
MADERNLEQAVEHETNGLAYADELPTVADPIPVAELVEPDAGHPASVQPPQWLYSVRFALGVAIWCATVVLVIGLGLAELYFLSLVNYDTWLVPVSAALTAAGWVGLYTLARSASFLLDQTLALIEHVVQ